MFCHKNIISSVISIAVAELQRQEKYEAWWINYAHTFHLINKWLSFIPRRFSPSRCEENRWVNELSVHKVSIFTFMFFNVASNFYCSVIDITTVCFIYRWFVWSRRCQHNNSTRNVVWVCDKTREYAARKIVWT